MWTGVGDWRNNVGEREGGRRNRRRILNGCLPSVHNFTLLVFVARSSSVSPFSNIHTCTLISYNNTLHIYVYVKKFNMSVLNNSQLRPIIVRYAYILKNANVAT